MLYQKQCFIVDLTSSAGRMFSSKVMNKKVEISSGISLPSLVVIISRQILNQNMMYANIHVHNTC